MPINHRDIAALMAGIAPVVRDYVAKGVAEVSTRVDVIEARAVTVAAPPDTALIAQMVTAAVTQIIPAPVDGKDVDPAVIRLMVAEEVAKIPAATNGKDGAPGLDGRDGAEGKPGRDGVDGKDGEPGLNGKDGTPGLDGRDGAEGKPGRDGVALAGAVIDRDGVLVLTLSDGSTKQLGVVVGKDADRVEIAQVISAEVAKFPRPKDGKDGIGFDDLQVVHDGERKFTLRYARGEEVKEFSFDLAIPLDRGVWKDGTYLKGDGVSHGGSFWIAQVDTTGKPEISRDWRLAAKRGRDGKDGKGMKGDPGPKGDPGIDRR